MWFFRRSVPFLIMLLLGAAAWRWHYLDRFLEYDELWTLENFSRLGIADIFRELASPNNHPVNTVLVKYLFHPGNNWSLRLGSLIFSCGTVIFGALCAARIYSKTAAFYTFAALALLPPFVTAGATARGYAGQLFFLTLTAYSLLRCRKGNIAFSFLAAISAVLAVVSLPSSMLYLIPGGGYFLWTMAAKKRLQKSHIYIFTAAAVFAAMWFYRHWFNFQETAKFAIPLTSLTDVYRWLEQTASGNAIFFPLLLAAVCMKRHRKITYLLLMLVIFPLAAACFTGAAPARVYLPSAAAAVLLMSPVKVRFRKTWFALALAIQFIFSVAALPDKTLEKSFMPHRRDLDADIMVYGVTDGYVVRCNRPQAVGKFMDSLIRAAGKNMISVRIIGSDALSGMDKNGDSRAWQLPPSDSGNGKYYFFRTNVLTPGKNGLLILPPMPVAVMNRVLQMLSPLEMLKLNVWLTERLTGSDGRYARYMLLAVKTEKRCVFPAKLPLYVMK